jgi:hypothetical protein
MKNESENMKISFPIDYPWQHLVIEGNEEVNLPKEKPGEKPRQIVDPAAAVHKENGHAR